MIDDQGVKQPIYETHRRFYEWARRFVADESARTGRIRATWNSLRPRGVFLIPHREALIVTMGKPPISHAPSWILMSSLVNCDKFNS